MKKAVIITADFFRDEEVIYPYIRLGEEGFSVAIATRGGKAPVSEYGFPSERMYPTLADTRELKEKDYDLAIIPGGLKAPDSARSWIEVLEFVRAMNEKKKVVAAICHGPWILISAGILKGKRATCHPNMVADLKNAGAAYVDAPVVEDHNLITSRRPRDLGDFIKAILGRFSS